MGLRDSDNIHDGQGFGYDSGSFKKSNPSKAGYNANSNIGVSYGANDSKVYGHNNV